MASHLNPLFPSPQEALDPVAYAGVNIHVQQFIEEIDYIYYELLFIIESLKSMIRLRA